MNIHPVDELKITLRETWQHRKWLSLVFLIVVLIVLVAGMFAPKKYTSSATLMLEGNNIMKPLMGKRAVVTGAAGWVRNARETIFIKSVLEEVIMKVDWGSNVNLNDELVVDGLIRRIRANAEVKGVGKDFIRFEFSSTDKKRAFEVTRHLTDAFILKLQGENREKSKEAFDFISEQVDAYHIKLKSSEDRLRRFKDENFDGTIQNASSRLSQIEQSLEKAKIILSELKFKKKSLQKQLAGEAQVSNTNQIEKNYLKRIAALEEKLDQLRLSYHDSYPDIVSIKVQIEELRNNIAELNQSGVSEYSSMEDSEKSDYVPLFQEIRSELSKVEANIHAQTVRIKKLNDLLVEQNSKLSKLNRNEAELAELTRDYTVNKDIYQDLLMKRENARVSMNIELEQKGSLFKIVNPASIPTTPTGLNYIYFWLFAPLAGLGAVLGLVYGFINIDQKIRYSNAVVDFVDVPILATIPHAVNSTERLEARQKNKSVIWVAILFLLIQFLFLYVNFKEVLQSV